MRQKHLPVPAVSADLPQIFVLPMALHYWEGESYCGNSDLSVRELLLNHLTILQTDAVVPLRVN